jgi:hypothetical protein
MPNGVICGGAADGSNQEGEMVTCQAITAWPAGSAGAAVGAIAQKARIAASSEPTHARRERDPWVQVMRLSSHPLEVSVAEEPDRNRRFSPSRNMIVGDFGPSRQ